MLRELRVRTRHGDAANELLVFYQEKVNELEDAGQYLMAVKLGIASDAGFSH